MYATRLLKHRTSFDQIQTTTSVVEDSLTGRKGSGVLTWGELRILRHRKCWGKQNSD